MSDYVLSAEARLDVQLLWNYIADDNIEAADKVKNKLRMAMRKIAELPGIGHRRMDIADPRLRFYLVYSYLIVYLPDTQPLQIVRVVHGSRSLPRFFEE